MCNRMGHILAWAVYGAAMALYTVGYAMHRLFSPRRARRPGSQLIFAISRRRWSLRRQHLAMMRMGLNGAGSRRMPKELQRGMNPGEKPMPTSNKEKATGGGS